MRVLDLFGGAGGVACGLDSLGVDHVSVEWWQPAADVALAAGHRVIVGDVRDPDTIEAAVRELGGVDLVWASPPCQAWSTAGRRLGAQDERNGWPWTLDALDALGLPPLIAENVTGMLHHSGQHCGDPERCAACYVDGWMLPELRRRYRHVDVRTIDAADVGVPQHRRRVIFQARNDRPIAWPQLTHDAPDSMLVAMGARQPWRTAREALGLSGGHAKACGSGLRGSEWTTERPAPTLRDGNGAAGLYLRTEMTGATARPDTMPGPAVGGAGVLYVHDGDPGARAKLGIMRGRDGGARMETRSLDAPSFALRGASGGSTRPFVLAGSAASDRPSPTGCGTDGVGIGSAASRDTVEGMTGRRRLTIDECAALQDFPDGYPWDASGSKAEAYKAVGNAVPPAMAAALVRPYMGASEGVA